MTYPSPEGPTRRRPRPGGSGSRKDDGVRTRGAQRRGQQVGLRLGQPRQVDEGRHLDDLDARATASSAERARSSRYCRHPEYDGKALAAKPSTDEPGPASSARTLVGIRGAVAVGEAARDIQAQGDQAGAHRLEQTSALRGDGADPTDGVVVLGDLLETCARHPATGGHPLEEGHDVVRPGGTAEAEEEHGVIRERAHRSASTASATPTRRPVKKGLLADVAACAGGPQVPHEVDDVVQLRGLEGEHPLVVAEREGRDGVGEDRLVGAAHRPVLDEQRATFDLGQEVPLVGADEGVDDGPVLGGSPGHERWDMALVELGGPVHPHRGPHQLGGIGEGVPTQRPDRALDRLGVGPCSQTMRSASARIAETS